MVVPVVVQYLGEDSRVSVEEVLVKDGVVVGEGLRQAGEARGGDLLQGGPVGLVPDASDVEDDAILAVHSSWAIAELAHQ